MRKVKFKNAKKILTISMASSMLLTSTQTTFATSNETDFSDVTNTDNENTPMTNIKVKDAKGEEYTAFKLMDLETDGEHYKYSINSKYYDIIMDSIYELNDTITTDIDAIKYLETLEDARVFADKIYAKIKNQRLDGELTTDKTGVFETTVQGYYLIAETGEIAIGTDRTLVMLDTLGLTSVEVKEKRGVPTLDKVIVENGNDVEHTDAGLGDIVTYKVTGTMPENIESYENYKYTIHDTLPEGLTYKDVVSISIDGTLLTNDVIANVENHNPTDCTIEFNFEDIKSLGFDINATTKVVVQYTAIVNERATIGNPGNQNKAHLEFSNDPYDEGSTTTTPDDDAKVFTFSVVVNKVEIDRKTKESKPLSGAEFTLQKQIDGEWVDMTSENVEYKTSEDGTIFTFETLDIGIYKLIESKVPTGYNKANDLIFEIRVSYDDDKNELSTLTVYDSEGNRIGETNLNDDNAIFSVSNGTINTDVINTTGLRLPSTGSTGAIMIYCASGIALTIGIASFVVAHKKKNI